MKYWLAMAFFYASTAFAENLPNVQWLGCHDGDTCAFNILLPAIFGTDIGVRLSGIDAPEILGKCDKEKQLALMARDYLGAPTNWQAIATAARGGN